MRKCVVANAKGGVGKTTVAANVGVGLARQGKRVCLLDCDPQGSLTESLGQEIHPEDPRSFYGLLVGSASLDQVKRPIEDNLWLAPGNQMTSMANSWLQERAFPGGVLKKRLEGVGGYDFLICDTSPSFSQVNSNAFIASEEAWIPVSMDFLSMSGVKKVLSLIRMIQEEIGETIKIRYVVPTFHDARVNRTAATMEWLASNFRQTVTDPIRVNTRLSEAPSFGQAIYDYAPESTGAADFEKLVRRVNNG